MPISIYKKVSLLLFSICYLFLFLLANFSNFFLFLRHLFNLQTTLFLVTNIEMIISLRIKPFKTGLNFTNWPEFKIWLDNFAKKKGFNFKVRNSRMDGDVVRNIIYECSRSGVHNPQVSADPTKRRNATSQRIQCPWKLNVSCPKSNNIVKINSFVDNHNH